VDGDGRPRPAEDDSPNGVPAGVLMGPRNPRGSRWWSNENAVYQSMSWRECRGRGKGSNPPADTKVPAQRF